MSKLTYSDVPLHEVLRATARDRPDNVAICFEDKRLTFADLDAESNRLANGLRALGLESGDRLGLFLPNCPEFVIGFYAASKLGAVVCPLNSSYREREITYQLNDAGARVLLTHAKLLPVVEAARPNLESVRSIVLVGDEAPDSASNITRFEDTVSGQSTDPPSARVDQGQLAALLYSSGTTGLPKGVMLTHRNRVCNHEQHVLATRMGDDDAYIIYMPMSHIFGLALMGVAVRAGAKQILIERFDLNAVVRLIEEHGVTWLFAVPPVLLALANAPDLEASQFRTVKFALSGAAPLPPDVARSVEARLGLRVIQGYGSTEAGATHYSPLDTGLIKPESGGLPMADTEHRVVDLETGEQTLGTGEVGEILVRGPQIMQGYWNAPEETARTLRGGWLHTGDIGWIDDEGYIYVVDRKKEMIKYKSFSIAPAELEAVLLEHPDVADCGVTGIEDAEAGEVPKAFVVPRAGSRIDLDALASFVAGRVAGYKQIRHFEVIDRIPKTPSGKILRRMLKK
ncbi:MAG: long-chain-fatty-acid--CoA ligase [Blastocatellia bacterium]|nr:long-chain-fatty-acid--CoA ligase [Blastocatellia bacterium]